MGQFDKYRTKYQTAQPVSAIAPEPAANSSRRVGTYAYSYMRDAVKSASDDVNANRSPQQELEDYLASGPVEVDDVVAWWGVSLLLFPCLAIFSLPTLVALYTISYSRTHCQGLSGYSGVGCPFRTGIL